MKKIIVKGIKFNELDNSMPTPSKIGEYSFGGMRILDTNVEDYYSIVDCYLAGRTFEVQTACGDTCIVKYGGDVILTYYVDKNSMKEYEATPETYIEFTYYLKKIFQSAKIKIIGLTKKERRLLIMENLR